MTDPQPILAQNLADVRGRIADAAAEAGRSAEDVTLVAVTKYVDIRLVRSLVAAGAKVLGESRPQQLRDKADQLHGTDVQWHLVGHLQRNKVRLTLPVVDMIQSVDSQRLMLAIDEEAARIERVVSVLLEVNISGDETKHGFTPQEIAASLPRLAACEHVAIHGLMAMAHREGGADVARRDFAAMRELRDRLAESAPDNVSMAVLSLGMSADFEDAVREGATMVRVGHALFEGLDLPPS